MRFPRFVAAQAAALAGTAVDFAVTIVGVEALHLWYLPATVLGNVAGGGANFYLGRHHVFGAAGRGVQGQAFRYGLVWAGSLLLNAAGTYLLTQGLGLKYLVSKTVVSLVVGLGFNYVMQLKFVFKKS